jgi:ribosomal-protein-alanine N-acetyltransferase
VQKPDKPTIGQFKILAPSQELEEPLTAFFVSLKDSGDADFFHPHPLTAEQARRLSCYAGKDSYYLIVEDGEVVGYGMLRGWDEGYTNPTLGIAIAPSQRGTGLASAFVEFLHGEARRRGAKRVLLKVYSNNVAAIRLYKRIGYRFEGENNRQLLASFEL